ncbi:MAG TPA: methyltransferase domain-containing protein [Planctomycetota bacterium]|nr:methyltransferase domain-containing protein [Planctomycetota bacterium]
MALSVRELRSTARDIYDLTAEEYLELFGPHQHDGYHVTWRESPIEAQENLIRVMAERSELRPGESVLDVGCGIGGTALWLEKNKGCRVTGISNSTEQVVLARRLARDARSAARFLQQDAERLAVDAPVDVVLLIGALGHLARPRDFFVRARRVLAPGGRIAVADWFRSAEAPAGALDELRADFCMPAIETLATHATWLVETGFELRGLDDLTANLSPRWRISPTIVLRPAFWRLLRKLGRRTLPILRGARAMERAVLQGWLVYGALVGRVSD